VRKGNKKEPAKRSAGSKKVKMSEKEVKKSKNKSDEKTCPEFISGDLGYKEVKQGGNNETKKGFYPY
jgi:hypothetical protein